MVQHHGETMVNLASFYYGYKSNDNTRIVQNTKYTGEIKQIVYISQKDMLTQVLEILN